MTLTKSIKFNGENRINLEVKSSFFQKLRGLLGVKRLEEGQGIMLTNCKQIHTFGMKFPIDVIILKKNGEVIDIISNLKKGKISRYYKKAYYIIELATNNLNKKLFKKGEIIEFI